MKPMETMNEASIAALVSYRIQRAHETLEEAQEMIERHRYTAAVNRLYYACFYAIIGALVSKGITTKTHAGVRQQFGLIFIKSGLIPISLATAYSELFNARITGDYDDFIEFDEETVLNLQRNAKRIISGIENILS